jgi:hypothetical protein
MKIELKEIINQLTECFDFDKNVKVSALIDENTHEIVGWTLVKVNEDGSKEMIDECEKFDNLKSLFQFYY